MLHDQPSATPSVGIDVGAWMPRIGVGLFFIIFGLEKFDSSRVGSWVPLFEQIGVGQWFRYVTGIVEVSAGLLLVPPATTVPAALILAATMLGAIAVHCFVIHDPGASVLPAGALIAVAIVGLRAWGGSDVR
jgi:putative oxidoreductase